MKDIVEDLRATAGDTDAVENASVARLLEQAASEIARLRLTEAEREAVRDAAESFEYDDQDAECARVAVTLRGLLERTK